MEPVVNEQEPIVNEDPTNIAQPEAQPVEGSAKEGAAEEENARKPPCTNYGYPSFPKDELKRQTEMFKELRKERRAWEASLTDE